MPDPKPPSGVRMIPEALTPCNPDPPYHAPSPSLTVPVLLEATYGFICDRCGELISGSTRSKYTGAVSVRATGVPCPGCGVTYTVEVRRDG